MSASYFAEYDQGRIRDLQVGRLYLLRQSVGFPQECDATACRDQKNSSIPLVTSLADARQTLSPESLRMLDLDILRNQIYLGNLALKNQTEMVNEYRTPIVIV